MTQGFIKFGTPPGDFQTKTLNWNIDAGGRYAVNSAARRTGTLPTTGAPVGSFIEVLNGSDASGGWKVGQSAGQSIILPDGTTTTVGSGGFIQSETVDAHVLLVCTTANTTWRLIILTGQVSDQTGNDFYPLKGDAAATADTFALRDGSGRMKAADGVAADDVATKGQVDAVVPGINAANLVMVQNSTTSSTTGAPVATLTASSGKQLVGIMAIGGHSGDLRLKITYSDTTSETITTGSAGAGQFVATRGGILNTDGTPSESQSGYADVANVNKKVTAFEIQVGAAVGGTKSASIIAHEVDL